MERYIERIKCEFVSFIEVPTATCFELMPNFLIPSRNSTEQAPVVTNERGKSMLDK